MGTHSTDVEAGARKSGGFVRGHGVQWDTGLPVAPWSCQPGPGCVQLCWDKQMADPEQEPVAILTIKCAQLSSHTRFQMV